jgi:hypothetical protein
MATLVPGTCHISSCDIVVRSDRKSHMYHMPLKLAAVLFAALSISGCAATTPYNPFKMPQADIQAKVRTVALAPIEISLETQNPAIVKLKFESVIAAKLHEAGFEVLKSEEYDAIWKQAVEKLGAIYDPASGKRDEKKFNAAYRYALGELRAKTKADAVLHCAIVRVNADFSANLAEWHGASDYVKPDGVWGTFSGPQFYGTIPALSLWVDLVDLQGTEMYVNFGGIQVASKIYGMKPVDVPADEFFTDDARNARSVDLALNPLIGQPIPPAR